jgi:hypothetical protein
MYDEIFQALAEGGDALLPKPFLDRGFDGVIRWKLRASEIFSVCHTCEGAKLGLYDQCGTHSYQGSSYIMTSA